MAQRGSEGAERRLGLRARSARVPGWRSASAGRARRSAGGQVERDDRRVAVGDGVEAADHARPASVGNDRHPRRRAGTPAPPPPRRRPRAAARHREHARAARCAAGPDPDSCGPPPWRKRSSAAVENLACRGAHGVRDGPRLGERDLIERDVLDARRRRGPRARSRSAATAAAGSSRRRSGSPQPHHFISAVRACPSAPVAAVSRPASASFRSARSPCASSASPAARARAAGGRETSSPRSRRSAVPAGSRCALRTKRSNGRALDGLLEDVALAVVAADAAEVRPDPRPPRVPSTWVQLRSAGLALADVLDTLRVRPPARQVVWVGDHGPERARRARRCGACARRVPRAEELLLAGQLPQVADQQHVREVAAGRGEALQVLDRLLAARCGSWSAGRDRPRPRAAPPRDRRQCAAPSGCGPPPRTWRARRRP